MKMLSFERKKAHQRPHMKMSCFYWGYLDTGGISQCYYALADQQYDIHRQRTGLEMSDSALKMHAFCNIRA